MSVSAGELAQMRADQADYRPDTAVIQSRTVTVTDMGGQSETWTSAATVQCRLAPLVLNMGEVINAAQITSPTAWVMTIVYDQAIDATERVVIGGDTYQVERVEDDHSHRTARRVYLRRLD
jgi:SPP1 family predicted phage head-tail adaptor